MTDLDFINQKYTNTKLSNLFLGFFEGLFIDGAIHAKEIKALITWVDTYPDCVNIPYFSTLYELLIKSYQEPLFLIDKKIEIQKVFHLFKNSKHFIDGTADIQRLHGGIGGCDM